MSTIHLKPLLLHAERRAVLLVLHQHPEWTLGQVLRELEQAGPRAAVLRDLTLGELFDEPGSEDQISLDSFQAAAETVEADLPLEAPKRPPDADTPGPAQAWCCDCNSKVGKALNCTPAIADHCIGPTLAWCEPGPARVREQVPARLLLRLHDQQLLALERPGLRCTSSPVVRARARRGLLRHVRVGRDALSRFGSSVRAAREQRGLSQEELAVIADLHRTYIGGVERGERNTSVLNVLRIARALGVRPGELLDEGDSV